MIGIDYCLPKISCLMITADKRFEYAKESIRCYVNQTYTNKELVIVTDASLEYVDLLKGLILDRNDIRIVHLKGKYTLGALRNISLKLAEGEIYVQWDDDDFNMPDRLIIQYGWLSKTNKNVCYFGDQLHYYFPTKQIYWENWWEFHSNYSLRYGLIPGTLMAYRKGFIARYPSAGEKCKAGEDSVLSDYLVENGQVTIVKGRGNLQIYSYHGNNVYDIEHHLGISKYRSHNIAFMNQNRSKICNTLKYMNFSSSVKVMGRDGLAFIYEADDVE